MLTFEHVIHINVDAHHTVDFTPGLNAHLS